MNLSSELKNMNIAEVILMALYLVVVLLLCLCIIVYIINTCLNFFKDIAAKRREKKAKLTNQFKSEDDDEKDLKDAFKSFLLVIVIVIGVCCLNSL